MIPRLIKAVLILVFLAAIGFWSVQHDDDTPRGAPSVPPSRPMVDVKE